MTCWSCTHYRLHGCALGRLGAWRSWLGERCSVFDYEPGTDEPPALAPALRCTVSLTPCRHAATQAVRCVVAPLREYPPALPLALPGPHNA